MIIIIMGVSGSGKSTVGKQLAKRLDLPFYDADDFHPKENIAKMSMGCSLTDEDRLPWLIDLSLHIEEWANNEGAVLACSALKEAYRNLLGNHENNIKWVYLEGTKETITTRMRNRQGHFMRETLLDSQFLTLEVPAYGLKIDITTTLDTIVKKITESIREPIKND